MALLEAGAQYTVHMIDLQNKLAYYAEKINPAGKVRARLCYQESSRRAISCQSSRSQP